MDTGLRVLPKIREALAAFREAGLPVVHVFRYYRADGSDVEITRYAGFVEAGGGCVRGTEGAEILDEIAPIEGEYLLEVSSPGVERELIKPEHFKSFIGADIMVRMFRPIDGIGKDFKGVLTGYDDGEVTITDHSGENTVTINKKDAAYIKLDDFD